MKHHIFSQDAAVQTDSVMVSPASPSLMEDDIFSPSAHKPNPTEEDVINKLTSADLGSILKWSREISRDINLSLALQRLTEIATGKELHPMFRPPTRLMINVESSGSQSTCVVIAREAGDYTVAISMLPPEPCQVHE